MIAAAQSPVNSPTTYHKFMSPLPQFALTLLGILFCAGDVAALSFLLTWQERAASPAARRQRLVRGVLPATTARPATACLHAAHVAVGPALTRPLTLAVLRNDWKRLLPPWPVVPPRLWLTGAGTGLVALSPVFSQEIWTHPRPAQEWSWVALALLLLAGGAQSIAVLLRWPAAYTGPAWMRVVVRTAALGSGIGITILMLLLIAASSTMALAMLLIH